MALAVFAMGTTQFVGLGFPTIIAPFTNVQPLSVFLFFIGATLGSALSLFIPLPVALLAGVGFVGVFSGATNTPLACAIMGIELFGAASGVYVGIACVVSYLMSGHHSIYGAQ